MTHIMLDLETWGKRPGCDIRSIGAVVFDPTTGTVCGPDFVPEDTFYTATHNPHKPCEYCGPGVYTGLPGNACENCMNTGEDRDAYKYPLARDPETVQWWNEQSEEARAAFANPVDLRDACEKFAIWYVDLCGYGGETPDARLWVNGPQFDVSILDAVYHAVGLPVPWHYRAPRDMRTIMDAAGMDRNDPMLAEFNHGTAHNALDDAISQAMIVCEAYKRLGLQK